MGSFSLWHWLVVLAVVLILFGGGGKISKIMSDMGKGVKGFKKGLKEESEGDSSSSSPTALSSSGQGAASDSSARKDETVKT